MPTSNGMTNSRPTKIVPAPIAHVMERIADIQETHCEMRKTLPRSNAFSATLDAVLSPPDATELANFISGSLDEMYGTPKGGAEFGQFLLDNLEECYQEIQRIAHQTQGKQ